MNAHDAGPNTISFTVRTPRETKEKIEKLAREQGRSTNYVVNEALAAYAEENAWQVEAIGKAIAKADAGGPFYAHEDAMAYLEARAGGESPERPQPVRRP